MAGIPNLKTIMWASAITAYLHYLGFMVAFGALVLESHTLKKDMTELTLEQGWRLVIADTIYGISALTVLGTGILRVLYFGQGSEYYLSNPAFHIKVGIFIVVGLLSLYPTFSFISWVKGLRDRQPPKLGESQAKRLVWLIRGEILGLAFIPLFASILARGIVL